MQSRRVIARLAIAASFAFAAIAAPSTALADPTGSNITEPADPAFVTVDDQNAGTLHVVGTTTGGTGNVDLRCYSGTDARLVYSGVPVVNSAFAVEVPLNSALLSSLNWPRPYCVLRAVPAGTVPAAAPDQQSPFQGPHIGWGEADRDVVGLAGAPNPPDTMYYAYTSRAQPRAFNDYQDAGDCGLCDTQVFDPVSFKESNLIWYSNAALYPFIPWEGPSSRSEVQVDGVNVYAPGDLSGQGLGSTLRDNPGFPSLLISRNVDPLTGDLTIHETDPFVPCDPQPAALPLSDANCPAFGAAPVTLDRTIVQDHEGLQIKVVDHWHSNDAQPHQLDALYDESNYDKNWAQAGHESQLDFPCTPAFRSYADGTDIAPWSGGPTTLYVKTDATTPEAGDGMNPFGGITYATPPTAIHVQRGAGSLATGGATDWQTRYVRTIPASGDLVITQVYSHGLDLASVQALAHEAEQALPAQGTLDCTPPPSATPGDGSTDTPATTGAADPVTAPTGSTTPVAATTPPSVKCRVPKLRGRTLARAKRLLRHANCRLGKVRRRESTLVRAGRVLRSTPRAGATRPAGARIAVRVALAKTS
jgi:hypothetical protein